MAESFEPNAFKDNRYSFDFEAALAALRAGDGELILNKIIYEPNNKTNKEEGPLAGVRDGQGGDDLVAGVHDGIGEPLPGAGVSENVAMASGRWRIEWDDMHPKTQVALAEALGGFPKTPIVELEPTFRADILSGDLTAFIINILTRSRSNLKEIESAALALEAMCVEPKYNLFYDKDKNAQPLKNFVK